MHFAQNKVSQGSLQGWGCLGAFPLLFFPLSSELNLLCVTVRSPAVCNLMFPGSVIVISLLVWICSKKKIIFFSFNCWSYALTFSVGIFSPAINTGNSTVSWYAEVAYRLRLFPFQKKKENALDNQQSSGYLVWNMEQLHCDQTSLQVCTVPSLEFVAAPDSFV